MVGDAVRFCELKVLLRLLLLLLWRVLVGLPRGDEGEALRCAPTGPDVLECALWL